MWVTPQIDSLTQEGAKRSRPMEAGDVVMAVSASPGLPALLKVDACIHDGFAGLKGLPDDLDRTFLYYVLLALRAKHDGQADGATFRNITTDQIREFEIPLPPLEEQRRIMAEIEGHQRVIDGARQILDALEHQLHIEPDWELVPFGSICENLDGKRRPITKSDRKPGPYPYYGASGIVDSVADYIFDEPLLLVSEDGANLLARSTPIAFSVSGKIWVNNHAHVVRFSDMATQRFVEHYLNSISIANYVTGAAQPKLNQAHLNPSKSLCHR